MPSIICCCQRDVWLENCCFFVCYLEAFKNYLLSGSWEGYVFIYICLAIFLQFSFKFGNSLIQENYQHIFFQNTVLVFFAFLSSRISMNWMLISFNPLFMDLKFVFMDFIFLFICVTFWGNLVSTNLLLDPVQPRIHNSYF